jgi:hypothetical protein
VSSVAEVFPHDDPVARFVVAMSMARNDVRHALTQAGRANDESSPEFGYWVRIATGHFFEAAHALQQWRQLPEIREFIKGLPQDGRDELRKASSALQKMGPGVLEHSRDRTFHYPYPTSRYQTDQELADALKTLGGEEVTLVVESETHGWFRLQFADNVAAALTLRKYDPANLKEQLVVAREGSVGFVNFATRVWEEYMRSRSLAIEPPAAPE